MSISFAIPVGVMAVSSLTVVSDAQAGWGSKLKRVAKRKYNKTKRRVVGVKDIVAGNRCKGGSWINGAHGLCGMTVNPIPRIPNGRIGDPVRGTKKSHDHRKPGSKVRITRR